MSKRERDDVATATIEVMAAMPGWIEETLTQQRPAIDWHLFDTPEGERGFAVVVVPTGPALDEIVRVLERHFGPPETDFLQEFPR